jgi:asparagine N-glycosylation enzyme membrane subunit Stt3
MALNFLKNVSFGKIFNLFLVIAFLIFIIYLSVWVRLPTINTPTVLDYDPWWFYRHAKEILENDLKVPNWDYLSFYPPGRPPDPFQGWPYTIILFYKILQKFDPQTTLTKAAILSPLIMVALIPVPAFFLGRLLTGNNLGGISVALFSTLTPAFIGVSMAGYSDSDAPVAFYSFLTVLAVFLALKKKTIPFYLLAILTNLLFVFSWGGGWLTLIYFSVFLPTLVIFRITERAIHEGKISLTKDMIFEFKSLLIPLLIIIVSSNIIAHFLNLHTIFDSFFGGLAFTGIFGQPLIVNISVAELQPINIFTREGFFAVAGRVGLLPFLLSLFGLPALAIYKILKKERISWVDVFLFFWALVAFYLISRGVRFSLLFSIAASATAGYVIGNLWNYLKDRKDVITAAVFGTIALLSLMFVSHAIQIGLVSSGMMISDNWYQMLDWLKKNADKDALVATWWDPGHIIAGYTGLKVHADGAHCGPQACIPYNHDIRIRDMGRIMSTSSEEEAIEILKRYVNLTQEQCQQAKNWFKGRMPEDACKPVSEVYLIASSDLIGKYYWMSCFGSFDMNLWTRTGGKEWKCDGRNFIQLPLTSRSEEELKYGDRMITITLTVKDNKLVGILDVPQQGIRKAIIKEIVFYQNGQELKFDYSNAKNVIDGLLWVDPTFRFVIFMDPKVRDSLFTTLFFWDGDSSRAFSTGKKLNHFQLVLKNPEIRLYKVIF